MANRVIMVLALMLALGSGLAVQAGKRRVAPPLAQAGALRTIQEIPWVTSLAAAQAEARRTGRLIFWMHMLGTIDGDT
jgi:hypothetical protein